jgi:hypothetical protein
MADQLRVGVVTARLAAAVDLRGAEVVLNPLSIGPEAVERTPTR